MSDKTFSDIQSAINAGQQAAVIKDRITQIGEVPLLLAPTGANLHTLKEVMQLNDQRAAAPRRLTGTARFTEMASFIEHVNRFKDRHSVIWADIEKTKLVAVFNYNEGAIPSLQPLDAVPAEAPGSLAAAPVPGTPAPRWGDHRAIYPCPQSAQWKLWLGLNGKAMTQEQFGEFLEDNLQDLVNPDPESVPGDRDMPSPAALIQMARNLRVHSKTEFERTINPHDGSGSLVFKKDNEVKGNTKVPPAFLLGIPVFEAGDMYRVEAKLRFRVEGAQARFFYELVRPELILKDAFDKVRAEARDKTGLRVLAGRPETQGTSADE